MIVAPQNVRKSPDYICGGFGYVRPDEDEIDERAQDYVSTYSELKSKPAGGKGGKDSLWAKMYKESLDKKPAAQTAAVKRPAQPSSPEESARKFRAGNTPRFSTPLTGKKGKGIFDDWPTETPDKDTLIAMLSGSPLVGNLDDDEVCMLAELAGDEEPEEPPLPTI